MSTQVAFTAPHFAATEIGHRFLSDGANAIDAMVAASAAISVVYPHMNSLAGDGFWLIQRMGQTPIAIDACGTSAKRATIQWYQDKDLKSIPERGGLAALCLGGTLDGWRVARNYHIENKSELRQKSLSELLTPSIVLANEGIEVSQSLQLASEKVQSEFAEFTDYQEIFCPQGRTLKKGDWLRNPSLGLFLKQIAEEGTESFFKGDIAKNLSDWLKFQNSPLSLADFRSYSAQIVEPLQTNIRGATLYNLPAPTQGIASLLILAVYDQLLQDNKVSSEAEHIHCLIEATKQAFLVRDAEVTDPSRLSERWGSLLTDEHIATLVAGVNVDQAMPWPKTAQHGDTVWMSALDAEGTVVSFIQSIYWEFGSGLVHPDYGLVWNNRGTSFSLDEEHANALGPILKPFHTLNPALAVFDDGKRLSYGCMGGEGQPQTQAAVFSRFMYQGFGLDEAISRGRWLLGRTWGDQNQDLKLEQDLYELLGDDLARKGHKITPVEAQTELMGHAGAIYVRPDGNCEAATDPRSDGNALVSEILLLGLANHEQMR